MTRNLATTLSLALLALGLAGCASPGPGTPAPVAAATASQAETPLRAVAANLYSSGQPAPSQWPAIRARGVSTVINLRPAGEMGDRDEAAEVAAAGMAYRQLDVAGPEDITHASAAQVQAWIDEAPGPVLVHCASGNRAGALLALIGARNGMAPEDAIQLGRRAGMTSMEAPVRQALDLPDGDR